MLRSSPEEALETLKVVREENCPGATVWNVLETNRDSILYEWQAEPCQEWPEQYELSRILFSEKERWRLAYTAKLWAFGYQVPTEERATWIENFATAEIREGELCTRR